MFSVTLKPPVVTPAASCTQPPIRQDMTLTTRLSKSDVSHRIRALNTYRNFQTPGSLRWFMFLQKGQRKIEARLPGIRVLVHSSFKSSNCTRQLLPLPKVGPQSIVHTRRGL